VTTIPVSAFYQTPTDNKVLRFCFCKKEETLEKTAEKLRRLYYREMLIRGSGIRKKRLHPVLR
jgi:aspartate/methionine/tyrosine aminotransferase